MGGGCHQSDFAGGQSVNPTGRRVNGGRMKAEGGIETGLRCRAAQINHGGAAATALPSSRVWRGSRLKICVSFVPICGTPHPQPLTAIREKPGDMVFDVPQMSKEEAKKFRD
jgi:hypothetical protein